MAEWGFQTVIVNFILDAKCLVVGALVIHPSIKPFEKNQDKMKRRKVIQMKKGTDVFNKYGHRNYGIGAFIDTLLEQELGVTED